MQLAVINRRAARKYQDFVGAMETVWTVLDGARSLVERIELRGSTYRAMTREELMATRREALQTLEALRVKSQTYEAELVSRDWRV